MGLDPSLRNWGIAVGSASLSDGSLVIDHIETITSVALEKNSKTSKTTHDINTAKAIYSRTRELIEDADIVCVEVPYGSQDVKAAVGRGICLGVLGSLEAKNFIYVTPQSVKKIIGSDSATKAESVALAVRLHPEAEWPTHNKRISVTKAEHCADAIHAIYAAAQTKEFKSIIQEYNHANQKTT